MNEHISKHTQKNAFELYNEVGGPILLESRGVNHKYDKTDIVVATSALEITGFESGYKIMPTSPVGEDLMPMFNHLHGKINSGSLEVYDNKPSNGLQTILDSIPCQHPMMGLYGAFGYDMVREVADIGTSFSKGHTFKAVLPSNLFVFGDMNEHVQLEVNGKKDEIGKRKNELYSFNLSFEDMSIQQYSAGVKKIVDDIYKGRFMQCVLSRTVARPPVRPSFESYEILREINPSPYCFYFDFENEQLFGASPELHLRMNDGVAEVRPIAGTIKRDPDPLVDFQRRVQLQNDEKELSEHAMLVDLARNDLYTYADPKSLVVEDFARIEEYPNLYHLVSGVTARTKASPIDLLLATLPAGTLSGAPKIEAMKAIEEIEGSRRGYYGGAIGYITKEGCNTGITIRFCHSLDGTNYVRSGAGIVRDSIPRKEAHETQLKAERMMQALGVRK